MRSITTIAAATWLSLASLGETGCRPDNKLRRCTVDQDCPGALRCLPDPSGAIGCIRAPSETAVPLASLTKNRPLPPGPLHPSPPRDEPPLPREERPAEVDLPPPVELPTAPQVGACRVAADCGSSGPCRFWSCQEGLCVAKELLDDGDECELGEANPCAVGRCVDGHCLAEPIREGRRCGPSPRRCMFRRCRAGKCVEVPGSSPVADCDFSPCTVDKCEKGRCITVANVCDGKDKAPEQPPERPQP